MIAAAAASVGCSGGSPTAPSSAVGLPAGASTASVQITVNPNPVPFSGAPITDAEECFNYENTWFYDQVLQETGGNSVAFTSRIDTFDGKTANNLTGLRITLPPHGTLTLRTRWCSGAATAHTAQSIFSGVDGAGNTVTVASPVAQLAARPK
jgi:hypothetical protein